MNRGIIGGNGACFCRTRCLGGRVRLVSRPRQCARARGVPPAREGHGSEEADAPQPDACNSLHLEQSSQATLELEPSVSTEVVDIDDTCPPKPHAWQGLQAHLHNMEVQATRSPTAVLTAVGLVSLVGVVVGTALRRLLLDSSSPSKILTVGGSMEQHGASLPQQQQQPPQQSAHTSSHPSLIDPQAPDPQQQQEHWMEQPPDEMVLSDTHAGALEHPASVSTDVEVTIGPALQQAASAIAPPGQTANAGGELDSDVEVSMGPALLEAAGGVFAPPAAEVAAAQGSDVQQQGALSSVNPQESVGKYIPTATTTQAANSSASIPAHVEEAAIGSGVRREAAASTRNEEGSTGGKEGTGAGQARAGIGAPTASQSNDSASSSGDGAARSAPVLDRHPLTKLEEVYLLGQSAEGLGGMRVEMEVDGSQQRCMAVFEEQGDAEVLRRQLSMLFGIGPKDLQVVARPTLSMLSLAQQEGQLLAFYMGGTLQVLEGINAEVLEGLLKVEEEAAEFNNNLQKLLREGAEVLRSADLAELVQRAQQAQHGRHEGSRRTERDKSTASSQGRAPTGGRIESIESDVSTAGATTTSANRGAASNGERRAAQDTAQHAKRQAPPPHQQQAATAAEHKQQQVQPLPSDSVEECEPGSGTERVVRTNSAALLAMNWWLSLPLVHVPQLRYCDGATGLMTVPVATLKGTLENTEEDKAGMATVAPQERSGGSSGTGGSSNGSSASGEKQPLKGFSRPVQRHIVAFQSLMDAQALSLTAFRPDEGDVVEKVLAMAVSPRDLLKYAESMGCAVSVLPSGMVRVKPGVPYEELVIVLHDIVQDLYWQQLASSLKKYGEPEKKGWW